MKAAGIAIFLGVFIAAQHHAAPSPEKMHDAAAETYENLATSIIGIRATEDSLVKGILMHHHTMAQHYLAEAADASGSEQKHHLEEAATEVSNLAAEGNKRVQAVRQRLLKAGHHHHTDAETKDDYIYVDSKEKKSLLALASKLPKLSSGGDIEKAADELGDLFSKTIAAE